MLNDYHIIPLAKGFNYTVIFDEMTKVFGEQGEQWFIYNGNLYLRDNKTYTWFMLKYG